MRTKYLVMLAAVAALTLGASVATYKLADLLPLKSPPDTALLQVEDSTLVPKARKITVANLRATLTGTALSPTEVSITSANDDYSGAFYLKQNGKPYWRLLSGDGTAANSGIWRLERWDGTNYAEKSIIITTGNVVTIYGKLFPTNIGASLMVGTDGNGHLTAVTNGIGVQYSASSIKHNLQAGTNISFSTNGLALVIHSTGGGGGGGATNAYSLIEEEGVPLTATNTLNFVGSGITASDGTARTDVTLDAALNALADDPEMYQSTNAPGSDKQMIFNSSGYFGVAAGLEYVVANNMLWTPALNVTLTNWVNIGIFTNLFVGATNVQTALAGKAPNTYAGVTNALGIFTGSTTDFLRADGTMNVPAGGGDVVADGSPWTPGQILVAGATDKHLYSTGLVTLTELNAGTLVVTNGITTTTLNVTGTNYFSGASNTFTGPIYANGIWNGGVVGITTNQTVLAGDATTNLVQWSGGIVTNIVQNYWP